jgi:hypothetical protein
MGTIDHKLPIGQRVVHRTPLQPLAAHASIRRRAKEVWNCSRGLSQLAYRGGPERPPRALLEEFRF